MLLNNPQTIFVNIYRRRVEKYANSGWSGIPDEEAKIFVIWFCGNLSKSGKRVCTTELFAVSLTNELMFEFTTKALVDAFTMLAARSKRKVGNSWHCLHHFIQSFYLFTRRHHLKTLVAVVVMRLQVHGRYGKFIELETKGILRCFCSFGPSEKTFFLQRRKRGEIVRKCGMTAFSSE